MPSRKPVTAAAPVSAADRIREIAYQLWIEAGRPDGAADTHWIEAERIAATEAPAPKLKKAPVRKKAA